MSYPSTRSALNAVEQIDGLTLYDIAGEDCRSGQDWVVVRDDYHGVIYDAPLICFLDWANRNLSDIAIERAERRRKEALRRRSLQ